MSKFARKHRGGVIAAGFVVAALLLGVIATSAALVMARRSESAAKIAEGKAKAEVVKAQALSSFLEDLLSSASPGAEGGRAAKVVDLLDRASAEMSEKLRDQPEAEINVRVTLGKTYLGLSLMRPAEQNFRRAYELSQSIFGNEAERTLEIATNLAFAMSESGGNPNEANNLAEQTLAAARRTLGEHHRVTYYAASAVEGTLDGIGKRDESVAVARQLVRDARAHPNIVPLPELARYLNNLAVAVNGTNNNKDPRKFAEIEGYLREVLQMATSGAKIKPDLLVQVRSNLANLLRFQGRIPEASGIWHDALAEARSALGESHQMTRGLVGNAAGGFESLQQYEEAIACRKEQLGFALEAQPQNQELIADIKYHLWRDLTQIGKFSDAFAYNSDHVAARQRLFGIYDDFSRLSWKDASVLQLSINEPWTSQAVRAQACDVYFHLLDLHPVWPMPADRVIPAQLRFKLFKWQGDAAKDKALSFIAEGNSADLHKLNEPPTGIYLLWLELPRANSSPLHYANWILFAPWQLSFYKIEASPEDDPAGWDKAIKSNPDKQATIQTLAMDEFWHFHNDLPPRLTLFGTVATSTFDFPVGDYRVITRSGAKHRWSVDGTQILPNWRHDSSRNLSNGPGPTSFRLEHFHTWDDNFFLWFRLQPIGSVVDAAMASLIDPKEANDQAVAKFDDPQFPHDATMLSKRAPIWYSAGRFKEAAQDFADLCVLQPNDHWYWYYCGCLLAWLNDTEKYHAHCGLMLNQFKDTKDHDIADRIAKTCLLLPESGVDIKQVNELVDRALSPGRPEANVPYYQMAKGMAEYRMGNYDNALDWLNKANGRLGGTSYLNVEFFRAMANQRLGKQAEARKIYETATYQLEHNTPKAGVDLLPVGDMENWLIAHVTMREAATLMEDKSSSNR